MILERVDTDYVIYSNCKIKGEAVVTKQTG